MNTEYDGDLNKASASVRTLVRTYDAAAGSQCTTALRALVEGIHIQTMSGEETNPIDGLWLTYLCRRHAASQLDAETHGSCVEITLALQGLALRAHELQLPTLSTTLEGLAAHLYKTHGLCVDAAQAASKAQTAAGDPYASADEVIASIKSAAGDVADVMSNALGLGIALGKLGVKLFGKR